jgi:O-antigen ligase
MTTSRPADGGLALARALLLAVFVTAPIATSASVVLEVVAYVVVLAMPAPRRRLLLALRDPVVIAALPLAAAIVVATLYGAAAWSDALLSLVAWRRMLLVWLAAALFFDARSKRLALDVLVVTCLAGTLVSFATFATDVSITERLGPGIVFHDYAVQGAMFSLAATVCVAALIRPADFAGDRLLGNRVAMAGILVLLVIDVVFILWGRTGAFAIVLMSSATAVFLVGGTWRGKALAGLAVLACGGATLLASPHVRSRVADGIHEAVTADRAAEATRFGTRVVYWRNTVRMIADYPLLGVGTGGFQAAYASYVRGVPGWQGNETGDPHNQYLKFQAEQGILGLAAFLFFIYWTFRCPAPQPWRALAAAALIGWCATSIASSEFSTHNQGRMIFFWLGAMLADETRARRAVNATGRIGRGVAAGPSSGQNRSSSPRLWRSQNEGPQWTSRVQPRWSSRR